MVQWVWVLPQPSLALLNGKAESIPEHPPQGSPQPPRTLFFKKAYIAEVNYLWPIGSFEVWKKTLFVFSCSVKNIKKRLCCGLIQYIFFADYSSIRSVGFTPLQLKTSLISHGTRK